MTAVDLFNELYEDGAGRLTLSEAAEATGLATDSAVEDVLVAVLRDLQVQGSDHARSRFVSILRETTEETVIRTLWPSDDANYWPAECQQCRVLGECACTAGRASDDGAHRHRALPRPPVWQQALLAVVANPCAPLDRVSDAAIDEMASSSTRVVARWALRTRTASRQPAGPR